MDTELNRMQEQASNLCDVRLRRIEKPKNRPHTKSNDDQILLLGLILILSMDNADKTLLMMLLYIFA